MLAKAGEETAKYEWMRAAQLYQIALDGIEPLETARVTELLARSYFKAAFQAESREEFKQRMQLAEAAYEKVAGFCERAVSEGSSKRLKARALFARFWIKDNPSDRRQLIEMSISLADEGARVFENQGDKRELADAHGDLLAYFLEAHRFAQDWKGLMEYFERAKQIGQKAIAELEALGEDEGLLESLYTTIWFLTWVGAFVLEPPQFLEIEKKTEKLGSHITQLAERMGTPYARCLANEAVANIQDDHAKALELYDGAALASHGTKDKLAIGRVLALAGEAAFWAQMREEDAERRRELLEKGRKFATSAIPNLEVPLHGPFLDWAYSNLAECLTGLANFVETESEKKKGLLRQSIVASTKGMAYKSHLSWPGAPHAISKAMYFLASMDIDPNEKRQLLRDALPIREEEVRRLEILFPHSWNLGVMRNYLALVRAELSKTEQDPGRKIELLQGAVDEMEKCVELCERWAKYRDFQRAVALYYEWYGDVLLQLYGLGAETDAAKRSIKKYQDAIAHLTKSEHTGPIGQVRWKIAKVQNALGDYGEASKSFTKAAEDYRLGAKKVPALEPLFQELASYMNAWSLIEDARLRHNEEQYLLAAENYTKVAGILEPTKAWNHLSKHYLACSFLEGGEALSRQERQDASVESFTSATKTFQEAKMELENRLGRNPDLQEKEELKTWIAIADGRERYCLGRIALEEAKVLDRKGEEEASAAKYGSASEVFGALMAEAEAEQSRRELETLSLFCQAWAKMKEAETRASPDLYAEAAEYFTKVEKVATRRRSHLLALANASICRSLEAGTQFRRTRNTQLYSEIKKELETATDYYQEAGLQNAADWTRATGKLFDALVYLTDAATERESKKKTELFHLAEKHLQLAAKLYEQAGFPVKKNEALKHLERAREEKELLLTPVEALAENPALTRATAAPVSLIRDQALGLERFDAANVVGNLSLHQKELGVGSDLTLELEMANVGKTAATLIKLENIAPDGFELDRERIQYRIEDNYIDMKGKRLEYLKTHEVKIPMKALRKGAFELRPRILFVDEKGTYRSYEFEPAAVTVRELGISGWLKGPSK